MGDYIVEFMKGDEVLRKKRFKELHGMYGAAGYILVNSTGKNLDKEYHWMVRRENESGWYQEYDNEGLISTFGGVDASITLPLMVKNLKHWLEKTVMARVKNHPNWFC